MKIDAYFFGILGAVLLGMAFAILFFCRCGSESNFQIERADAGGLGDTDTADLNDAGDLGDTDTADLVDAGGLGDTDTADLVDAGGLVDTDTAELNDAGGLVECAVGGLDRYGVCWYLGALGLSCADVCGITGATYARETADLAGAPLGTPGVCGQLLDYFDQGQGLPVVVVTEVNTVWCNGLGCVWDSLLQQRTYCATTDTEAGAAEEYSARVCACF